MICVNTVITVRESTVGIKQNIKTKFGACRQKKTKIELQNLTYKQKTKLEVVEEMSEESQNEDQMLKVLNSKEEEKVEFADPKIDSRLLIGQK